MVLHLVKFYYYYCYAKLLEILGLITVNAYIKLTPDKPIDDSLRAIFLEQLLFRHRRYEKRRYEIWQKVLSEGRILGANTETPYKLPELETEDVLAKRNDTNYFGGRVEVKDK